MVLKYYITSNQAFDLPVHHSVKPTYIFGSRDANETQINIMMVFYSCHVIWTVRRGDGLSTGLFQRPKWSLAPEHCVGCGGGRFIW